MANPLLSLAAWTARRLPMPVKRGLYRFRPLAGLLRGALNRAAPHGFTPVVIAAGGLQGLRLSLDLQEEKDYWLGTYEPDLQAAVADLVGPGMLVYDVGANIGYISLLLARRVGAAGHVYAFEALPANLERLRLNLELSGLSERVTVVPAAVVEQKRPARFLVGPSGGMGKAAGSAGRQEVVYSQELEVAGLSLDEFVYADGNPPPQAVKMDIEGGEVLALAGDEPLVGRSAALDPVRAARSRSRAPGLGYAACRRLPAVPDGAGLPADPIVGSVGLENLSSCNAQIERQDIEIAL